MLFGRAQKNPINLPGKDAEVVKWEYTTCGYCSTGCSIEVGVNSEGQGVRARGVGGADVNRGKLCLKGIFEHELFTSAGR
ncbi:MAG: nitrate reductase, partial [Gammaproteobacteria bacterium]|nr:nitrate reductase [Gammaproteobacteria bacterium]